MRVLFIKQEAFIKARLHDHNKWFHIFKIKFQKYDEISKVLNAARLEGLTSKILLMPSHLNCSKLEKKVVFIVVYFLQGI